MEVRAWKERVGPPFFVLREQLPHSGYLGFRSVYSYPNYVRDHIEQQKSTAGLEWAEVYSDCLFMDFDNQPDAAREMVQFLVDEDYQHEAWDSGGRSVHLHIPIVPIVGQQVPWSQRVWVQRHAPKADVSFYTHAGQYRLAGTRHEQTGRRKTLTHEMPGRVLQLPMVERPGTDFTYRSSGGMGHLAESTFFAQLLRHKGEGERRVFAWHLAKLGKAAGLSIDDVMSKVLWWNDRHCRPSLTTLAVRDKVWEAFNSKG